MQSSPAEARAVQLSTLTAGLSIAYQVAAKSLREGLFFSTFNVADLPLSMLGSALVAIPVALSVARLMTRFGPARVGPAMFLTSSLLSLLEWLLLPHAPRAMALIVYFHVSIGGALLMSAFWSLVNEHFDPHALKRSMGRIGVGATLGGLVGGATLERLTHYTDARSTLLLVSALSLAAGFGLARLAAAVPSAPSPPSEAPARVRFSGYLWTLALLVASTAAVSAFADFALKQTAVARFTSAESLVRFFAVFYTGASLVSFVLQAFVARRSLEAIGIGGTLSIPPASALLLGALSLLSPSFVTIAALRGSDLAFGPSLFRSAFEPLFAPVPAATKRATKGLIDVVFDKGGDALASLSITALSLGGPALLSLGSRTLATVSAAFVLLLSLRARRGYVAELEASLRAGTFNPETAEVSDATTRLTLSATAFGIDRKMLLEQIAQLRQASPEAEQARKPPPSADDQLLSDVRALVGHGEEAIRAVLARPNLDPRLAAFILPHLADDGLAKPAVLALRGMVTHVMGLLTDAMSSSTQPLAVRRRVPYVLRSARGAAAARALLQGLSVDAPEVRHRAALALLEVSRDDPTILPEAKVVHALLLEEASRTPQSETSFDHVFALLSLCTSRGGLELARQGLRSDDRKLRGTALEYLESLLPEPVRAPLIASLSRRTVPPAAATRSQTQLLDELQRSIRADFTPQSLAADPD